jgi:hypothetical protein
LPSQFSRTAGWYAKMRLYHIWWSLHEPVLRFGYDNKP